MTKRNASFLVLPAMMIGVGGALCAPASAQVMTSKPVVQALPSGDVYDLKKALRVLARSPRDLNALLNAGYASLQVQDFDAAIGFFGRAEEISPEHPRVKMGKAAVYLNSGRPLEALKLFAEAEAAGASASEVHSDRGLAYDLVGDQLRAQAHYREALRVTPDDDETRRRMAVSQAIAGNESAFADTLRPLVDKRDFPAFRSQAFGLAILGEEERAKAVTEAVMPADLARRITPYLAFMPRLTKAQQAAAANLGIFPRAADIGRDDPRIAQYTSQERAAAASTVLARSADNRLAPTGEPLGQASEPAPARVAAADRPTRGAINPRKSLAGPGFDLRQQSVTVNATPSPPPAAASATRPAQEPSTTSEPARAVRVTRAESTPVSATPPPVRVTRAPVPARVQTPAPVSAKPKPKPSFADAFGEMGRVDTSNVARANDAVNIAAINIRREVERKPEPKTAAQPVKPAHPQRYWVQLGTAVQADGLQFDWRRLSRAEPDLLGDLEGYTAPYGEQHRLLAGPVSSRSKRDELVKALTEKGLGVLPYTSPEGTEVKALK